MCPSAVDAEGPDPFPQVNVHSHANVHDLPCFLSSAGKWGNGDVMATLSYTATIPAALAAGEYLIRVRVFAAPSFRQICTAHHPSSSFLCF